MASLLRALQQRVASAFKLSFNKGPDSRTANRTANRTTKRMRGDAAESQALQHLIDARLVLVERNYTVKAGEIDLIMREGETLVFVEVRMRQEGQRDGRYGGAAASVTSAKQQRITRAAQHYLLRFGNKPPVSRCDVVLVDGQGQVEWMRGAF
jgi:putative endonuclease